MKRESDNLLVGVFASDVVTMHVAISLALMSATSVCCQYSVVSR